MSTDRLAEIFGDARAAATVLDFLDEQDCALTVDDSIVLAPGYTRARLAVVVVSSKTGRAKSSRYIAKFCPPDEYRPNDEGRRHFATLHDSLQRFAREHLVRIVYSPITCDNGAQVIIQEIAGGSIAGHRPLSTVDGSALARTCDRIRLGLLRQWVGDDYDARSGTVATLLELELRDSIERGGWLWDWAERRALRDPANEWLELAPGEVLPNPFLLLLPGSSAADRRLTYLAGRSHGDLHGDNVLIPCVDEVPRADGFRLIDLATFDPCAPLSRDIATLAISLIARWAGQLDSAEQDSLLRYVVSDAPTSMTPPRSERTWLTDTVRALFNPKRTFITDGWLDVWTYQVRVSCLAQALLHATYRSIGQRGRWWCFRLAARLAGMLLPGHPAGDVRPRRLGPELFEEEPRAVSLVPPAPFATPNRSGDRLFIDRDEQRMRLRAALQDDSSPIIVVSGPPGVGKTRLVEETLIGLDRQPDATNGPRVRRHDAAPGTDLGMKALINDIEKDAPPNDRHLYGPASRARIQAALDGFTGNPIVIIVESAEYLLDDARSLRDQDLDEAMEVLSNRPHSPVKIVLVSQVAPRSDGAVTWPDTARKIPLSGLEDADFRDFFKALDPGGALGLAALEAKPFSQVHGRLRGNPRLAELLHAVVCCAERAFGAREVAPWLASMTEEEIPQRLVDELVTGLSVASLRTLEALAAFGTPVVESTITALLEPLTSGELVREALRTLTALHIVRATYDRRYYLPQSDIDLILEHLPPGDPYEQSESNPTRRNLLFRAACVLDSLQKETEHVHTVGDLYPHFARINVLIRAAMYDDAHEVVMTMERLLRKWNQAPLLLEQRKAVRGRLEDPYAEMENHTALGDVYSSLGQLAPARDSYQAAVSLAQAHHSLEDLRRIYINMGQMYEEHNDFGQAHDHFAKGLAIVQEEDEEDQDVGEDRLTALEGLADCARAWGIFTEAISLGAKALAVAEQFESPRTVDIALKLSRWFADLDRMRDAFRMLAVAQSRRVYDDKSARAACLDGEADLVFRRGGALTAAGVGDYLDEAAHSAQQAVNLALEQRDPDILRQARTTLCAIHLRRDDIGAARREIELAARHRREGHSLFVVALRGLVALRGGESRRAAELFSQLREEAQVRVHDGRRRTPADHSRAGSAAGQPTLQDFAAADMLGLALCASALANGGPLAPAVEAFRTARDAREAAPGLSRQLRFLVRQLGCDEARADRLGSVIEAISMS